MFQRLAFLVLLFSSSLARSQDSAKYALGADLGYHPQDLFLHVRGQLIKKKLTHEVFFGFGVAKTILQGQFMPGTGYDLSYRFRVTDWFSVAPLMRVSYSLLNTQSPGKNPFIHTTEGFLGGRLAVGKKNKIAFTGGIGPAIEWKYDAYEARNSRFFMWNYFAEIAYYYEF
ncbi:hypothetical protein D3C87_85550 [compost metagenome]